MTAIFDDIARDELSSIMNGKSMSGAAEERLGKGHIAIVPDPTSIITRSNHQIWEGALLQAQLGRSTYSPQLPLTSDLKYQLIITARISCTFDLS